MKNMILNFLGQQIPLIPRKFTDNRDQILDEIVGRGNDSEFLFQRVAFQKNCELRLFIRITGVKGKSIKGYRVTELF